MKPLISICIPVYNGSKFIDQTLNSLLIASKELKYSLFEIIVSDNCSSDDTILKALSFKKKGLNINLIKNKKNFGYDMNLDILIKNAKGNFTWFLGCGEIVKSESLKRLVDFISTNLDLSNLILDYDIFSENLNKISNKSVYKLTRNILISGKNNFTKNRYSASLSANVVNTKMWLKVVNFPLIEQGWCHVERILSIISINKQSETYILFEPYFTLYQENDGWWTTKSSYKLLLSHIKIIDNMPKLGFNEKAHRKVRKYQEGANVLNAIVLSRKNGFNFNDKELKDFKKFFSFFFYLLLIKPFAYLPINLCSIILSFYFKVYHLLALIYKKKKY